MFSRPLTQDDYCLLEFSLAGDDYHKDNTPPEFFYDSKSVCNVYEDDEGPVLFVRGTKALRIDIQFVSNHDFRRNREVMLKGFEDLVEKAKAAGFTEIIFNSTSPLLIKFCKKHFGFQESNGELRKIIV